MRPWSAESAGIEEEEKRRPVLINRRTIRIEWGDYDPAGIVFYPRYLSGSMPERRLSLRPLVFLEEI
jgi:hypothetical protein